MKRWEFVEKLLSGGYRPGMRGKLIVLLVLVMAVPLLVSSWLAWQNAEYMGARVTRQTAAMTDEMRESVTTVGKKTVTDAIDALEMVSREKIERLSTDMAREIAAFLYERDNDIRFAAGLTLTEDSFRHFLANRTRELMEHGPWKLAPDEKSWIPVGESATAPAELGPMLRENQVKFHYRPPDTQSIRVKQPIYLEVTFVDLDGREQLKVTTGSVLGTELRDVSRRENTYCSAETYFQHLSTLQDDEIYVSHVIGPYVPSRINGSYLPELAAAYGIPFEPEKSAYAGKENPVGKRFQGLIRWAVPVLRDGRRIGYVTLALDHTHLMAFTNHLVATEERGSAIPDAAAGNYGFIADYKGRIIAHPRQYHIIGYDAATGKTVPPWLDEETYSKWKKSGKEFHTFIKDIPPYNNPSRHKLPAWEQVTGGQMGIDYRYLNFAPQCSGFQTITEHGGSGSFHLYWSGLWKLNATAPIPYFTGQYGSHPRGFGHVGITANIEEFHRPALATKKFIDQFIGQRDAALAQEQEELRGSISASVAESVTKLGQSTGIMLALVVGLAVWIASVLRNRVAAITRGTREFQQGNLKHRLQLKTRDELGELAAAFNQMAQSIQISYEKLSKSEERFRAIFNQTFQLAGFLTSDGTLVAANAALQEFVGQKEAELVGSACWTLPWWADSPGLQRQVREAVQRVSAGEFLRFEATRPRRWGGTDFFDFSLKPFKDEEGEVVNLVLEARDITELKEAEHELRRHRDQLELFVEERTQQLTLANKQLHREILDRKQAEDEARAERDMAQRYLDIAGAIIVLIDTQLKTMLINKKGCEVLGYDERELIGRDWFETVIPKEDRETYRKLFSTLLANNSEAEEYAEHTIITKDKRPLIIAWQHAVLSDMSGKRIGILSSGVDITEIKKAEADLRRARDAAEVANRAKSTFLANMSHEIRTPLNAILGCCQLMLRDPTISDKQTESIEMINRSGEHLLALINEVLEMSKIESGCLTSNQTTFDLYRLLEDVEMMFRFRTEAKGLQFEVSRAGDLPRYVVGDQSKIRQVLINLLGNAVKFTEYGGLLLRVFSKNSHGTETADAEGSRTDDPIRLILEVQDTGVGIRKKDVEKVFQPFEQVGKTRSTDGGTGLGLAITREFVRIMDGNISVASRVGQGSTFQIKIPVHSGNEEFCSDRNSRRRVIGLQPGQPHCRVLVVDDIETNRHILSSMLTAVGLEVQTADNGEQAVVAFDRNYAAVLSF
jgi:PAS domain S-box-containing protein